MSGPRDWPNWAWGAALAGLVVWVVIVFVAVDPLLRKLLQSATGIELVRHRNVGIKIVFSSATLGRGAAIAWLWDWILYFVAALPILVGILMAATRWRASHPSQ